jgi:hypothetical protein
MDLGTLSCPIHPREAYERPLPVVGVCVRHYLSTSILGVCTHFCGWLGLPLESATTVPTATQAPMSTLSLITKERVLLCFAGAITTPAGREAAIPMPFP